MVILEVIQTSRKRCIELILLFIWIFFFKCLSLSDADKKVSTFRFFFFSQHGKRTRLAMRTKWQRKSALHKKEPIFVLWIWHARPSVCLGWKFPIYQIKRLLHHHNSLLCIRVRLLVLFISYIRFWQRLWLQRS